MCGHHGCFLAVYWEVKYGNDRENYCMTWVWNWVGKITYLGLKMGKGYKSGVGTPQPHEWSSSPPFFHFTSFCAYDLRRKIRSNSHCKSTSVLKIWVVLICMCTLFRALFTQSNFDRMSGKRLVWHVFTLQRFMGVFFYYLLFISGRVTICQLRTSLPNLPFQEPEVGRHKDKILSSILH